MHLRQASRREFGSFLRLAAQTMQSRQQVHRAGGVLVERAQGLRNVQRDFGRSDSGIEPAKHIVDPTDPIVNLAELALIVELLPGRQVEVQ